MRADDKFEVVADMHIFASARSYFNGAADILITDLQAIV